MCWMFWVKSSIEFTLPTSAFRFNSELSTAVNPLSPLFKLGAASQLPGLGLWSFLARPFLPGSPILARPFLPGSPKGAMFSGLFFVTGGVLVGVRFFFGVP